MRHKATVFPVPHGLVQAGPIVQLTLSPNPSIVAAHGLGPQLVPQVVARMMVDTGAHCTLIDRALADTLGVSPISFESIVGVSGKPESYPVFPLSITLGFENGAGGHAELSFAAPVVGMPAIANGQHNGLLGRDFLQHFELFYNGPGGYVEIRMPATLRSQVIPSVSPSTSTPVNRKERREKERREQKALRKKR